MSAHIVGRTIKQVRPLTDIELRANGWRPPSPSTAPPPLVIVLDDDTLIFPSSDPEGNEPGCLFGSDNNGPFYVEAQP